MIVTTITGSKDVSRCRDEWTEVYQGSDQYSFEPTDKER